METLRRVIWATALSCATANVAAARTTHRGLEPAVRQLLEPLVKPVRGQLFHQVRPIYSRALERAVGRCYQSWPAQWIARGEPIWSSAGRKYFEYGGGDEMGLFALRPRRGWCFVTRDALELDEQSGSNALYAGWLARYASAGRKPPRNTFPAAWQQSLAREGLPTHSDFYETYKIAGFTVADYRDRPKTSYVFLHPEGGEVRLLAPSRRRR